MNLPRPFPIEAVHPQCRTLVLAPHPDDFDVIAITLRRIFLRAPEMRLLVVTGGHSGVEDSFVTPHGDLQAKRRAREEEQRASAAFFGLEPGRIQFLAAEGKNHCLAGQEEALAQVGSVLAEFCPDLVFLPHGNDSNPDHQVVCRLALKLAAHLRHRPKIFLNADPKTLGMRPDFMSVFGEEEAAWKAELLRFHASQHTRNLRTRGIGFDQRILAANRELALQAGLATGYIELFEQAQIP